MNHPRDRRPAVGPRPLNAADLALLTDFAGVPVELRPALVLAALRPHLDDLGAAVGRLAELRAALDLDAPTGPLDGRRDPREVKP